MTGARYMEWLAQQEPGIAFDRAILKTEADPQAVRPPEQAVAERSNVGAFLSTLVRASRTCSGRHKNVREYRRVKR